jgi:hypothetical protein
MYSPLAKFLTHLVAVLAVIAFVVPDSTAQGSAEAYVTPDFRKPVFDSDKVLLTNAQRKELCEMLTAVAVNFPISSEGVSAQLKEMALAIALRVDAVDPSAQTANLQLSAYKRPSKVDIPLAINEIAENLRNAANLFADSSSVDDEKILRCYLLDIARHLEPGNLDGVRLFQLASTAIKYPGWEMILNSKADNGFLFPSESELMPTEPVDPDSVAGNPESDLQIEESQAILFGFEQRANGALRTIPITVSLSADKNIREPGVPIRVLFPTTVATSENILAKSTDKIIAALAKIHKDWPVNGRKIVARFEPGYIAANGRAGELPLAVALDMLFTGKVPAQLPNAAGLVAKDGSLEKVPDLGLRLQRQTESAHPDMLIIPEANVEDLADLLVLGDVETLLRTQILQASTLAEALNLAHRDYTPAQQKALLSFVEARNVTLNHPSKVEVLHTEIMRSKLAEIYEAMPQHVSAGLLLKFAIGEVPARLTSGGSIDQLRTVLFPYTLMMKDAEVLTGVNAESVRVKTVNQLTTLRDKLAPDFVVIGDQIKDYATEFETYAKLNSKTSNKGTLLKASLDAAWEKIASGLDFSGDTVTELPLQ